MKKNYSIHSKYQNEDTFLNNIIDHFETSGENYGDQNRNSLKIFDFLDFKINVKAFKIPNLINQISYRFFRKSKAQRSYEYACKLKNLNIGTPEPIAYFEFQSLLFFKRSFYISEHFNYDITYRELTVNFNYPDYENIARAFTRFTHSLHEKNVHFLDHSPGNTLIKKINHQYEFYLVDLNRMEFRPLSVEERIKNFCKLTVEKPLIKIMANEYASINNLSEAYVYELMQNFTDQFQKKIARKDAFKKKIKFWKK